MEVSPTVMNRFCNLTKIARQLHEEATPIKSLDEPKLYEVPASDIGDLGNALQLLGEQVLMEDEKWENPMKRQSFWKHVELSESKKRKHPLQVDDRIGEKSDMNDTLSIFSIIIYIGIGVLLGYNVVCLYHIKKTIKALKKMR